MMRDEMTTTQMRDDWIDDCDYNYKGSLINASDACDGGLSVLGGNDRESAQKWYDE